MAGRPTCFKDFVIAPLGGGMDTRSPSGKVAFNDFRLVLNMDGSEERGYCRLGGWQPYLKDSDFGFKNQDLHDQMVGGQFYHRPYDMDVDASKIVSGIQYPIFYPGFYVDDYTADGPTTGPFCGYVFDTTYPMVDTPNEWSARDWFVGYPYNMIEDFTASGALTCTRYNIQVRGFGGNDPDSEVFVEAGFDSVMCGGANTQLVSEADNSGINRLTHTLHFCFPSDVSNITMIDHRGDVLTGFINAGTSCTCPCSGNGPGDGPGDGGVDWPCLDGDYKGSLYYLHYTYGYPGYNVAAYYGGAPIYSYFDYAGYTVQVCYPGYLLLSNVCTEAITGLLSMNSVGGRRRLIASTRSRIYVNDDRGGNWRIIADGLGGSCVNDDDCTCSTKRIKMAASGNTVLFVNGVDPVLVWDFDEGPSGCFFWSADYVAELRQLGIETARVVQAWRGFAFIGNVVQDGDRFTSRLFWSDYNSPTSWTPGGESLAASHDFGNGETILAMEPLSGRLRIFTDKAIYDAVLVSDETRVFAFQEIYRGEDVLRYPNTLVNTGDTHVWMAQGGIFIMAETDRSPQRIPWVHRASGAVFNGLRTEWLQDFDGLDPFGPINSEVCENAVGGWDGENKAIWFSWPTDDNVCPNMTMILWPRYQKSTLVDHGFTAFTMHKPDFGQTIRDFFAEHSICDPSTQVVDKEGLPYSLEGTGAYPYLYNYYESSAYPRDPNSAIAALCGICLADLCKGCEVDRKFLMASAVDKTIKEFTPEQELRQMLESVIPTAFPETSIPTYTDEGYFSMMQGDGQDYQVPEEKLIKTARVTFTADEQTIPNELNFQIGYGAAPECLSWADSDPVDLSCLGADYDPTTNVRPATTPRFEFYNAGYFLAWRFWTEGTGGAFCVNSLTFSVRKKAGCW